MSRNGGFYQENDGKEPEYGYARINDEQNNVPNSEQYSEFNNYSNTEREELMKVFDGMDEGKRAIATRLVDELLFIESKLAEVRELPFLEVSGDGRQRQSPAAKLYKDFVSQQSNIARILLGMTKGQGDGEEESPLRAYLRNLQN